MCACRCVCVVRRDWLQQALHQPSHQDTVGYEFDADVLYRRGPSDTGIGCPRALLFDVRGAIGAVNLFDAREDAGSSGGAGGT